MRQLLALGLLALVACSGDSDSDGGDDGPVIAITPASVEFTVASGDPPPTGRAVQVTNAGAGGLNDLRSTITYRTGSPSGWLSAGLGSTSAPTDLLVRPLTGDLPAGIYAADVEVSSTVAGVAPEVLTVLYTVNPGPAIALVPTTLTYNGTAGGGPVGSQLVQVQNSSGGNLTGLSQQVVYAPGGPTGWLTVFLGATSAPTALIVQANPIGLAAGTYGATITVLSDRASNSPQSVAVTFVVTAPALR